MLLEIIEHGNLICLAIVAFLIIRVSGLFASDEQRRWGLFCGGVALLSCAAWLWLKVRPRASEVLLDLTLRSFCVGGIGMGLSSMGLALLAYVGHFFKAGADRLSAQRATRLAMAQSAQLQREREIYRQRQQEEYRRSAPERERQEKERAAQSRAASEEQKRRTKARRQCELRFKLLEPEIKTRFSREDFEAFSARYLTDSLSAEELEANAAEVMQLMQMHKEAANPSPKFANMQELDAWYQKECQSIENSTVHDPDGEMKGTRRTLLNAQYTQFMESFFETK